MKTGKQPLKVTVLGAGAGGTATAFDFASHGHVVRLFEFPQFTDNIDAIVHQGGIRADGALSGFGPVDYAGHDIDRALSGAELILVVGPAYSTEPFAKVLAGKLEEGQVVIVTPGSCGGALALKKAAGINIDDDAILLAETSTLHYAVRLVEPGKIRVFLKLKAGNLLAGLPADKTGKILKMIAGVYPGMEPAENVMQTSLQNANPIIHPAVTLSNSARIEMTGGDFLFYEEGVSDSVGRLIEALDKERIAIGEKLGLGILPDPEIGVRQGYMLEANYGSGYRAAPGFRGIAAQPQLDHRYLHEDVGYGLVFMSELGKQLGVETPSMDAVIELASVLMARDYRAEALRTPKLLGIAGQSADELRKIL
jgi:opine dehydrogenase